MDFFTRPRNALDWEWAYPEELYTSYIGYETNLIAHLEHHAPNTHGHSDVQFTAGKGNLISQNLYNSIPEENLPQMEAGIEEVTFNYGPKVNTLGQVFVPILLINAKNGKGFRIVLHAYVMEGMAEFGMLIGWPSWIRKTLYKKGR